MPPITFYKNLKKSVDVVEKQESFKTSFANNVTPHLQGGPHLINGGVTFSGGPLVLLAENTMGFPYRGNCQLAYPPGLCGVRHIEATKLGKGDFLCFRIVDSYMSFLGPTKTLLKCQRCCSSQFFKKLRRCLRCSLYFFRCRTSEEMVMEQADGVRCVVSLWRWRMMSGGKSWVFLIPEQPLYTVVKVDGATPKRWISKGPW